MVVGVVVFGDQVNRTNLNNFAVVLHRDSMNMLRDSMNECFIMDRAKFLGDYKRTSPAVL